MMESTLKPDDPYMAEDKENCPPEFLQADSSVIMELPATPQRLTKLSNRMRTKSRHHGPVGFSNPLSPLNLQPRRAVLLKAPENVSSPPFGLEPIDEDSLLECDCPCKMSTPIQKKLKIPDTPQSPESSFYATADVSDAELSKAYDETEEFLRCGYTTADLESIFEEEEDPFNKSMMEENLLAYDVKKQYAESTQTDC